MTNPKYIVDDFEHCLAHVVRAAGERVLVTQR